MAYTNFQNCTQEEYNEIIYSGDAKHRLKLLFNGVEYPTANSKTESIKRISKILSDGGERFSLDNFKAQTLELIIHDIDLEDIQEPISISIGTLVDDENDTYEYVPIGIFNLDETPTTSSDKTTIKVSDNASKFDFLYDASGVIERNGGEATMLQILQDICDKARVTLETTSFPNMNTKVSVWDNSINARQYVMYIGEKAGRIPNISRTGGLILIDLQSNETVEVESEDGIIEIDDALARTPKDLQLQGNTYQQTYTGKNLLNPVPDVSSINGVTVSYNSATQEITLNGTCTTNNSVVAFGESSSSSIYGNNTFQLLANTTLYLRIKYISGTSTGQYLLAAYNNNFGTGLQATTTSTGQDVTNSKSWSYDTTFTKFRLRFENGTTFNNYKIKVYMSTTDNNYEPFVGRTASPNPDYPQAINNVTGRQTIDVVGKNLFNFTGETHGNNVTTSIINKELEITWTGGFNVDITDKVNLDSLKVYTISFKHKGDGVILRTVASSTNLLETGVDEDYTLVSATVRNLSEIQLRFVRNGNVSTTGTAYIKDFQIEQGSTATTYEPYKGNTYEINLGKNLFDSDVIIPNMISSISTQTPFSYNSSTKELTITNSSNDTFLPAIWGNANYINGINIDVEKNTTYTFHFTASQPDSTLKNAVFGLNKSTNKYEYIEVLSQKSSFTFNTGNYDTITFRLGSTATTGTVTIFSNFQLEKGNATSYSPYKTPIELNKIGNYQDSFKKSTGKNLLNQVESGGFNTTTGEKTTGNFYRNSEPIQVQPNTTYIFSINGTGTAINVLGYKADMTYTGLVSGSTISANQSFTIPDDVKYINIFRGTSAGNQNWQIEKSSTITSYEPYLPIGTWYIEKKIGKVVLNGSESYTFEVATNFSNTGKTRFTIYQIPTDYNSATAQIPAVFNIAINSPTTSYGQYNNAILMRYVSGQQTRLDLMSNTLNITTVADFKNWLGNNNLITYYQLNTPTYTEITNTDLINQLESIELLNGINNITVSSGDLAGGLKITYDKINDGIELDPLLFEKYTEGDLLEITRVVYEDAIRKFEYGDETGATLYINSANPYIVDASEIYNIYLQVRGLSLYSMKISKMIGNPALDPWDIIKFTYKNKEYRTLAQNTLTYNGVITQSFDTQIGTKEKSQENVTINSGDANFKRLYARIDQAEGNIELNASQVSSIQSDLKENYFDKTSTEQLILNSANGLTNTFSEAGGNNIFRNTGLWFEQNDENNPYEFWNGQVERSSNDKASNKNALLLQNGTLSQEQDVPNGNYTVSFKYIKLIPLSVVKCYINDIEYELTETTDTEFQEVVEVNSKHINVRFVSDTNNSCEIYDLMVNAGGVKLAYSQNQNETTTDTVNISKGITITSSDQQNVVFKANADGVRIFEKSNMTTPKTKFTDKGTETNYLEAKDEAIIVDVLIQRVGNQTWFTKI